MILLVEGFNEPLASTPNASDISKTFCPEFDERFTDHVEGSAVQETETHVSPQAFESPDAHGALNIAEDMSVDGPVQDVPIVDAQNVQDVHVVESSSNAPTRQTLRVKNPPIWQIDYVLQPQKSSKCNYPI